MAARAKALILQARSLSDLEIRDVLKAVGLGSGGWYQGTHWNTCPNGHLYVIGDCGGAMVQSKCPDCGEIVGGQSHSLARGNQNLRSMEEVEERVQKAQNVEPVASRGGGRNREDVPETREVAADQARAAQAPPVQPGQIAAERLLTDLEYAAGLEQDRRRLHEAQIGANAPAQVVATAAARVPNRPGPEAPRGVALRCRLPNNELIERKFGPDASEADVLAWFEWEMFSRRLPLPLNWQLVVLFPRRVIERHSTSRLDLTEGTTINFLAIED